MYTSCKATYSKYNTSKLIFSVNFLVGKVISCFSIVRNWERLSRLDLTDPATKSFSGINGIRFYNMLVIILAHTIMGFATSPILNTRFMETVCIIHVEIISTIFTTNY